MPPEAGRSAESLGDSSKARNAAVKNAAAADDGLMPKRPRPKPGQQGIRGPPLSILVVQVGSLKVGSLIEVVLSIVPVWCGPAAGVVPPIGPRSAAALLPVTLLPASLLTALIAAAFPHQGTHEPL
jgi:hypothetical protein